MSDESKKPELRIVGKDEDNGVSEIPDEEGNEAAEAGRAFKILKHHYYPYY